MITAGIDVGTSAIKFVLFKEGKILHKLNEKIRRRDPKKVVEEGYNRLLKEKNILSKDVLYLATTGEGEIVNFRTGHFYGMTTHARGALFLNSNARGALDVGALHARALMMNENGRVLQYRMTNQCASGTGQFLENISRYLGISVEEIGSLSLQSKAPETCSSICAVLAETDVINMVSRGIQSADILKGIHLSIAQRLIKLLKACKACGKIMITGGLSQDKGLVAALNDITNNNSKEVGFEFLTRPDGAYAGAIGAAIWASVRQKILEDRGKN